VCLKNVGYDVISYSVDSPKSLDHLAELGIHFKSVERQSLFSSKLNGLLHIIKMTWKIGFSILNDKPQVILMYDDFALIPIRILKFLVPSSTKLWYHNHDVLDGDTSKFSLARVAQMAQKSLFSKVDLFTLPSLERTSFFPMDSLKGKFIFLPNYPGKWLNNSYKLPKRGLISEIKLIYQGRISEGHGLQELINLLSKRKDINLTIIGIGEPLYIEYLKRRGHENNLEERLIIMKPVAFTVLPEITSKCHIGIAINIPLNIQYQTGGSASNKIYEYAALGLPIIYYDTPQYIKYLDKYDWASGTNLSSRNLEIKIDHIKSNYNQLAKSAKNDFENHLNYEDNFEKVISYLEAK
jgi:hypothetical protein